MPLQMEDTAPDAEGVEQDEKEELDERGFFAKHVIGDYDYGKLCTPRMNPWKSDHANQSKLQFVGPNDTLPVLVAMLLGFQHSLAVVGGTVIPGIILGNMDPSGEAGVYLVSYALITSGKQRLVIRLYLFFTLNQRLTNSLYTHATNFSLSRFTRKPTSHRLTSRTNQQAFVRGSKSRTGPSRKPTSFSEADCCV